MAALMKQSLALAVLAALLFGSGYPLSPTRAAGPVTLSVEPPNVSVGVGQVFAFSVRVDAGSQPVVAMDVFLDFDRTYLEIVDAAGNPATASALSPGLAMPQVIFREIDNGKGQVTFSAGVALGSGPTSGSFVFVSGYFKAKAATGGTTVSLHYNAANPADLRNVLIADPRGDAVPGIFNSSRVAIGSATAVASTATPAATATRAVLASPAPPSGSLSTPTAAATSAPAPVLSPALTPPPAPTFSATAVPTAAEGGPTTPTTVALPATPPSTALATGTTGPSPVPTATLAAILPATGTPTSRLATPMRLVYRIYVGGW